MNRVKLVTHMSMMVSLLACLILALSGYLAFSDKTQGSYYCTELLSQSMRFWTTLRLNVGSNYVQF